MSNTEGERLYSVSPEKEAGEGASSQEELTVEALRRSRERIELQIAEAKAQKAADLEKLLTEREILIAEDRRTVDILTEAETTVAHFESLKAQAQELDMDQSLVDEELDKLKKYVADLRKQRERILKKYEAIMNIAGVEEKVREQARQENISRELSKRLELAKDEINRRVADFVKAVEKYFENKENAFKYLREKESALMEAKYKIKSIIREACNFLDEYSEKDQQTKRVLIGDGTLFEPDIESRYKTYEDYLVELRRHRAALGWFSKRQKTAIDHVLDSSNVFQEANLKKAEFEVAKSNYQTSTTIGKEEVVELYKQLAVDVLRMESEIAKPDLRSSTYDAIFNSLKKKFGYDTTFVFLKEVQEKTGGNLFSKQ